MHDLAFGMSTHELAHTCAALLRDQGFSVRVDDLDVLVVSVEQATVRWATALVAAVDSSATAG